MRARSTDGPPRNPKGAKHRVLTREWNTNPRPVREVCMREFEKGLEAWVTTDYICSPDGVL